MFCCDDKDRIIQSHKKEHFSGDIIRPMFMIEAGWWAGMMVLPLDEQKLVEIKMIAINDR